MSRILFIYTRQPYMILYYISTSTFVFFFHSFLHHIFPLLLLLPISYLFKTYPSHLFLPSIFPHFIFYWSHFYTTPYILIYFLSSSLSHIYSVLYSYTPPNTPIHASLQASLLFHKIYLLMYLRFSCPLHFIYLHLRDFYATIFLKQKLLILISTVRHGACSNKILKTYIDSSLLTQVSRECLKHILHFHIFYYNEAHLKFSKFSKFLTRISSKIKIIFKKCLDHSFVNVIIFF